jgi:very-short-patch-repair endonuclease
MSGSAVDRAVRGGRLIRIYAGVYAVGYRRPEPVATAMAAVLACGPGALLSHDSAVALWGLRRRWPRVPEVTARRERRRDGIRTHRSQTLVRADRARELGVPVTTAQRTIRDLEPRLTRAQFTRMVNEARRAGRLTANTAHALLGYASGPTRSEFEAAFLRFCGLYQLPVPRTLVDVHGFEVDALFVAQRVIVELDGWEFRNDRSAFVSDRERDASLLDRGYATYRITWERLHEQPQREAARIQRILARRTPVS